MGRNRNKNKKQYLPKPKPIDFSPPPAQSFIVQQASFSELNGKSVTRSEIKNANTFLSEGSSFSASDFQQQVYRRSVKFTIKQWLLLGMSRIIPHSDKLIHISMKKNEVSGPKNNVEKFCNSAQNEIHQMKMKVLKFKYEISPQEIQFQMQKQWKCQIFSSKLLRNVADKIQLQYDIQQEMKNQIDGILKKQGINSLTRFLWVQSDAYDQAFAILQRVHKQCAQKALEGQSTIVSILNEMSSHSQQQKTKIKSSHQNTNKNQTQWDSSGDYSRLMQSKKSSQLQESSMNYGNDLKKKQEKSKKTYNPKPKIQHQSSMKNLQTNPYSFFETDFTVIQSQNNLSLPGQRLLSKRQNKVQEQFNRDQEQFIRQRPRRENNQNGQRRPQRRQREGQQSNNRRQNRYESSQDKTRENINTRAQYNRGGRVGNRQRGRNIIFSTEYPDQYFSSQNFKEWSKRNKTLKRKDQYTLEMNQKYSPDEGITYVQVTFYGEDPNREILYAIHMYFNYEKLIKIQEEDEQTRYKIIDKFKCKDNWLTVEYKKIYTRDRNPKYEDLRRFAKKDNTAQHMNTNKNITHAFMITGLMTEVSIIEGEIEQFVKEIHNTCRKVDIQLKFPKIEEFMRRKQVHSLIEEAITQQITRSPERYKLHQITPTFAQVLVEVELFKIQDRDVDRTKKQLSQRLVNLIDSVEFESDRFEKSKKSFETILQKFIIFENSKKGLTLIAKQSKIKDQMIQINKQIEKSFKSIVKQFSVKQKSQLTLCKDYLLKLLKQSQFSAINARFEQTDGYKVALIGPQIIVNDLFSKLEEYYETIEAKLCEYNVSLTQQQLQIIEKDKLIQKKIEDDYKITLKFKSNFKIGAVFIVEPHLQQGIKFPIKTITFENEFNFESLPKNSVFFFRNEKQINSIKQPFILPLKNHVKNDGKNINPVYYQDKIKQCFYIYGYDAQPQVILNSSNETTSQKVENIFMYMPEHNNTTNNVLKQMLKKLCENKNILSKELKITIICKKNTDLKKVLTYKQGIVTSASKTKRIWYTLESSTKLFYSDQGNRKIQQAYLNKVAEIQLNNEDLNMTNKSHTLDFQNKIMTHMQSGKSFPIKVEPNKITFTLNGEEKTIPDSEFQKIPKTVSFFRTVEFTDCQLSIGFYKVDLVKLKQTNLFSKYERAIGYDEEEIKESQIFDLQVSYDVKSPKLGLQYSVENQNIVKKVQAQIKEILSGKLISKSKPFNAQFTLDLVQKFTKQAEEQNVFVEISIDKTSFLLKAYNQKNIDIFFKILTHLSKTSKVNITYPDQWAPQNQDIQTFKVPPNTLEFNKVQIAFTAGRITQLVRIQNKIVFKKFYEEKIFLKELNEGNEIQQMLLYHGTRKTDPKTLYEDRQECFNVNYTGESNLLGKGTYFAEKPEYSVNYSHIQDPRLGIKSMFYCRVLVGESEKCPGHSSNIRDTGFKNQAKGIRYESMTDFLQGSNIFVVYKNRRAYPLYLIKFR